MTKKKKNSSGNNCFRANSQKEIDLNDLGAVLRKYDPYNKLRSKEDLISATDRVLRLKRYVSLY